jgi:hypothetical protein
MQKKTITIDNIKINSLPITEKIKENVPSLIVKSNISPRRQYFMNSLSKELKKIKQQTITLSKQEIIYEGFLKQLINPNNSKFEGKKFTKKKKQKKILKVEKQQPEKEEKKKILIDEKKIEEEEINIWKKKYMILTKSKIFILKKKKTEEKKENIKIEGKNDSKTDNYFFNKIITIEISTIFKLDTYNQIKNQNNCFYLQLNNKKLIFATNEKIKLENWMNKINKQIIESNISNITNSFSNLYNNYSLDESVFTKQILKLLNKTLPIWESPAIFKKNVKKILKNYVKDEETSQNNSMRNLMTLLNKEKNNNVTTNYNFDSKKKKNENELQPWEIQHSNLKLESKIAEGFFGEVFIGKYLSKKVAVKKLKFLSDITDDINKMILSLKEEAEVLVKLRHPNILLFMGNFFIKFF